MTWIHEMTKGCPRCSNPIEVLPYLCLKSFSPRETAAASHIDSYNFRKTADAIT